MGAASTVAVISPAAAIAEAMPGRWWLPSNDALRALPRGAHVKVRICVKPPDGTLDFWSSSPTWVRVTSQCGESIRGPIVAGGLPRAGYRVGDLLDLSVADAFDYVVFDDDGYPRLNVERALHLLGKHALLAVREVADGDAPSEEVAVMRRANETAITVETLDGTMLRLPPDTRPFEEAAPGEYPMGVSDEAVVDPDYLYRWDLCEAFHTGEGTEHALSDPRVRLDIPRRQN